MPEIPENAKKAAYLCYFIALILFAESFDTLTPLEYGLDFNTITKNIFLDKVYTSGRYMLGVGHGFRRFPATLQQVEFASSGTAAAEPPLRLVIGSAQVTASVAFQYRLKPKSIGGTTGLFKRYSMNYHQIFIREAKSAILKAVNGTTVEDFYNNRPMIQSRMEAGVRARFATDQVGDFAEIPDHHFQLLFVQIDKTKQDAIVNTEVLRERQREKLKENEVSFISGQQEVVLGEAARVVNQTMSSASSNASFVRNNATAEAERVRLEAEQLVYSAAKRKLNLTNSELLRFLWIKHLNSSDYRSTMKVGFEQEVMRTLRMDHAGH